jgi:hypothetical protein
LLILSGLWWLRLRRGRWIGLALAIPIAAAQSAPHWFETHFHKVFLHIGPVSPPEPTRGAGFLVHPLRVATPQRQALPISATIDRIDPTQIELVGVIRRWDLAIEPWIFELESLKQGRTTKWVTIEPQQSARASSVDLLLAMDIDPPPLVNPALSWTEIACWQQSEPDASAHRTWAWAWCLYDK